MAMRRAMVATRGRTAAALRLRVVMVARVRWGNVGRACAAAAVVALVVAWPRLEGAAPRLPGDGVVPVVAGPVAGGRDEARGAGPVAGGGDEARGAGPVAGGRDEARGAGPVAGGR